MIDELKLLRGKEIEICDGLTLYQPTVGEICDYGEEKYFNTMWMLCSIPSDVKSILWDIGIDWNEVSDWNLFLNTCRGFTKEYTKLVFGDLDFSEMEEKMNIETGERKLVYRNLEITEDVYNSFIGYLRESIGYVVKREKAGNKFTKDILIREDRKKREKSKGKEYESTMSSMIISLVNTEEFSYTYKTVYDVTMYQLTKSFIQIQGKKAACALYQGSMSGFVDTSKIKSSNFEWTYNKEKYNNK